MRADALRNRRILLDAAAAVLADKGLNVPVSYIAQQAGLGKATVFRRFPTKESLIAAVIEDQLGKLADLGETLASAGDPAGALRDLLTAGTRLIAENRGLCEAMYASLGDAAIAAILRRLVDTTRTLLAKAQQAGAIRGDVTAEDLLLLQRGIAQTSAPLQAASPGLWRRYLDLAWDGLRPEDAGELSGEAPVFPGSGPAPARRPATQPA
ncbi:MAG: TetR/AcrR family transcriptional regulator [Trebonia sp.]